MTLTIQDIEIHKATSDLWLSQQVFDITTREDINEILEGIQRNPESDTEWKEALAAYCLLANMQEWDKISDILETSDDTREYIELINKTWEGSLINKLYCEENFVNSVVNSNITESEHMKYIRSTVEIEKQIELNRYSSDTISILKEKATELKERLTDKIRTLGIQHLRKKVYLIKSGQAGARKEAVKRIIPLIEEWIRTEMHPDGSPKAVNELRRILDELKEIQRDYA